MPIKATLYAAVTLAILSAWLGWGTPVEWGWPTSSRGPVPSAATTNAVYKVVAGDRIGTAFYLGRAADGDALFATNHHVANDITVEYDLVREHVDGLRLNGARVVAVRSTSDLALLKAPAAVDLGAPVPIDRWTRGRRSQEAWLLAYPQGEYDALPATLTEPSTIHGDFQEVPAWQIAGTSEPGSSGGPVVDADGRLLAVNFASQGDQIALAIDVAEVREFLSAAGCGSLITDRSHLDLSAFIREALDACESR